ncbi:MAG: class I SAM-dependent methyltransferase [Myxococcota bacterium]
MDRQTVRALNEINRSFYRETSAEFDASRADPWPGWSRVADHIHPEPGAPTRILDVGCGNARFGAFLADRWGDECNDVHYTGVDSSAGLLSRARERALPFAHCELIQEDLIETLLEAPTRLDARDANRRERRVTTTGAPELRYALIGLFGVLHHIPSAALRFELLVRLGQQLAPQGLLAFTCWQFGAFDRFRDKIIAWDDYNRTALEPIDTRQLEPGDHLLPWADDADARRYCHFSDELEAERLLESDFEIVASYTSDGREGSLNRYFICRYTGRHGDFDGGRKRESTPAETTASPASGNKPR